MTDLLDNALVKRYFASDVKSEPWDVGTQAMVSLRVLAAMQEPIKNKTRILTIYGDGLVAESTASCTEWPEKYHPQYLRLPDRFQTKPHECNCEFCGSPETVVLGERARRIEKCPGGHGTQHLLCDTHCKCQCYKPSQPEKCGCPVPYQGYPKHCPVHNPEKCGIQNAGLPCVYHDSEKCDAVTCIHGDKGPKGFCTETDGRYCKDGKRGCACDSETAVEAKIEFLLHWHWGLRTNQQVKEALRELVDLARGGKP